MTLQRVLETLAIVAVCWLAGGAAAGLLWEATRPRGGTAARGPVVIEDMSTKDGCHPSTLPHRCVVCGRHFPLASKEPAARTFCWEHRFRAFE